MTTRFLQITPFMHVPKLEQALAFFSDVLGFRVVVRIGDYAYIDVRNVDALYAELKPKLDTLPAGDVHGPADKSYGQRELLVLAPDGNLLAFGQAIG